MYKRSSLVSTASITVTSKHITISSATETECRRCSSVRTDIRCCIIGSRQTSNVSHSFFVATNTMRWFHPWNEDEQREKYQMIYWLFEQLHWEKVTKLKFDWKLCTDFLMLLLIFASQKKLFSFKQSICFYKKLK